MNKNVLVFAMALVLAGCAVHGMAVRKPDPMLTAVYVVDGKYIVVDQEPIYFGRGKKDVKITWELVDSPGYSFPKDGIVISNAGSEFDKCHAEASGLRFSCQNKNTVTGKYKYTIKLEGTPAVDPLDPTIVNY